MILSIQNLGNVVLISNYCVNQETPRYERHNYIFDIDARHALLIITYFVCRNRPTYVECTLYVER